MREVLIDEHLSHIFGIFSARPGALLRPTEEAEKVSDVSDWVGVPEEIEVDESDMIAVDEDMVGLEVTMDQGGRSTFQAHGYRLHHSGHLVDQVGPSGNKKCLRLLQPSDLVRGGTPRRGDIKSVKIGDGPRRRSHRVNRALAPPDDLRQRYARDGFGHERSQLVHIGDWLSHDEVGINRGCLIVEITLGAEGPPTLVWIPIDLREELPLRHSR